MPNTNNAIPKTNPLSGGKCLHGVSMADHCQSCVGKMAAPNAGAPAEPTEALQRMTASRASFFMTRFLREEKLLGPNEQAALHFVIDMLAAAPAQQAGAPLSDLAATIAAWELSAADLDSGAQHGQGMAAGIRQCIEDLRSETPGAGAPLPLAPSDGTAFLCRIWGEDIDHTLTAIVPNWEGVRRFCVEHWTGKEDATDYDGSLTLDNLKTEFDEHEEDQRGGAYVQTWEIGGVSVERICDCTPPQATLPASEPTYTSTQATNCAGCGKHKHTPLRIDAMGGYVCLTCIDQKLGALLGEFGYQEDATRAQPQADAAEPVAGIELAARFVEKRLLDYDAEHGMTDPATGTREYPGDGDEYVGELQEIADGIRAIATQAPSAAKKEGQP